MLLTVVIAGVASGQSPTPESDDLLFAQTLPIDIDIATAAVLADWLRQLELPDTGDRSTMQQRLLDHYKLDRSGESSVDDTGIQITVDAARSVRSRSDERGHSITVLEGEVSISVVDPNSGTIHRISADRIVYHKERTSLTASGSVTYAIVTEKGKQVIHSESLSVNTNQWDGTFYDGSGRIDQLGDSTELAFTYKGRVITRHDDDSMILEDATVTSSENASDPYYRIQAERLWVLDPQEWAVRNAFLHIGEVPVLYLPYFLRPGGRLLFHPAIGQRNREGTYLQTTTYLTGHKALNDTYLSFRQQDGLGVSDTDDRRGLFLFPDQESTGTEDPETDFLALMLDLYTRLGVFAGLHGRFGGLSIFGGVAVSRTLVENDGPAVGYTPYLQGSDGELVSHWDTTRILGSVIPLRYGLELSFEYPWELGSLQGGFELFSDPIFTADFLGRAHDLPTNQLIGLPTGPLIPLSRDRLEWYIGGESTLDPLIATPVFSTLAVPTLSARWLWESRIDAQQGDAQLASVQFKAASPTNRFYYPEKLTFPMISAVVAGSLYRLESKDNRVRARLGYVLRPVFSVDHQFDNEEAVTREKVGLDVLYSRVDTRAVGQMHYSASAFDGIIGLNGMLTEVASYQVHTRKTESIDPAFADILRRSDLSRTHSSLRLENTVKLQPMLSVAALSESSLSYGLDLTVHEVKLDLDTADRLVRGLSWNREQVRSHRAGADLVLAIANVRARLDAGINLPPRQFSAEGRFDASVGPFSMTLRSGIINLEQGVGVGKLQLTSLDGRGALHIGPEVSVTQSIRLDESQRLELLSTKTNVFGLTGTVHASVREPLDIFGNSVEGVRPSLRVSQLSIGYRLDRIKRDYWKNRIQVDAGLETRLTVDPEAYVDENSLSLDLRLGVRIHKLLDLSFWSRSVNRHLYRYFPGAADEAGERWVNPIIDLVRSFNFFNPNDRIASAFNLESLRLEALHQLGDWNLALSYQGRPEQQIKFNSSTGNDESRIVWSPAFSVEVRWVALPELYSSFRIDRRGDRQ